MRKTNQLRIRKTFKCAGSLALEYVKTDQVPNGEMWCIQHVAYENQTGARGTFRRYIDRGDYKHYLGEHASPGAAELITWDGELWLMPGDLMTVQQASPSQSDILALYCTGYVVELDEEVVAL
jgi:hypothetical protein